MKLHWNNVFFTGVIDITYIHKLTQPRIPALFSNKNQNVIHAFYLMLQYFKVILFQIINEINVHISSDSIINPNTS